MYILVCVDDTDDLSKATSTGRISQHIESALLVCSAPAFAGDGNGDGSGGGKNKPLEFVASVPAQEEAVDAAFSVTLEFNKNVIDPSVLEGNKACFALYDAEGNAVDIVIETGDVQVDPETKNFVTIKSAEELTPGTYDLVVGSALQSNSGVTLGEDLTLQYTVDDAAASGDTAGNDEEVTDSDTNADADANANAEAEEGGSSAVIWIIIIVVVIIVVAIIASAAKRKRQ